MPEKDIRKFLEDFSPEERESKNKEQIEENEAMFKEFVHAHSKECCSLCGNKLSYFNEAETCFHWFQLPVGIKKKNFTDYLREPIGYFMLESYFRWMATIDAPLKNINDLSDEMSDSKLREVTIKYQNIEWTLTYGATDLEGHKGSKNADFPHFHIQMLVDGKPFIRFNDFHIPFSKPDLFNFRLKEEAGDLVEFSNSQGEGMSIIEDEDYLKELADSLSLAEDEENATFDTSTMFQMPEGETMSGEVLAQLMEESKTKKIPLRKVIKEYNANIKSVTQISPGKGVPEMKKRNKRKK
jgi:hypothetical protein